jgi:RecA-family ATPase
LGRSRANPAAQFVYGKHLIRKFLSTTAAPGGVGKSSLGFAEALAMTSGKPLLGITPSQRLRVWLWNGEDPLEELQRRVMAAAQYYGLKREEIEGYLFINSGRLLPIIIAEQTRDGAKIAAPVVEAVTKTLLDNKIDVLVIDPFVASHRVNDNNAIELVAKTWAQVADVTNCAVELIHHVRKTGGAEVTVEDGRGASALLSAARSARVLNGMTKEEAGKAGIEAKRHRFFFRVDNGKANLAPPEATAWFNLASESLANGDRVGVVTNWKCARPVRRHNRERPEGGPEGRTRRRTLAGKHPSKKLGRRSNS